MVEIEARILRLNRGNSTRPVGENQNFSATLFKKAARRILNRWRILRGHQRTNRGQICYELGGMFQGLLALEFEGLKCFDGGAEVDARGLADSALDGVADDEQSASSEARRNGK